MKNEIELHKLVMQHNGKKVAVLFSRVDLDEMDLKVIPGKEEEVWHLSTDELDTFERVVVDGMDFFYVRRRDLFPRQESLFDIVDECTKQVDFDSLVHEEASPSPVDDSLAVKGEQSYSMAASVPFGRGTNVNVEMDEDWITVSVDGLDQCRIPAPWSREQPVLAGRMSQEEAETIAFREVETILGEQFTLLRPSTVVQLSARLADWIRRAYNAKAAYAERRKDET